MDPLLYEFIEDYANSPPPVCPESKGRPCDKFMLLIWKNWVLQFRNLYQTLIEILVPVLCAFFLIIIRSRYNPKQHDPVEYNPFCTIPINIAGACDVNASSALRNAFSKKFGNSSNDVEADPMGFFKNFCLIYSPRNDAVDEVMSLFSWIFGNVTGLMSSTELNNYYALHGSDNTFAAIQFDDSLANGTELGENVKVSLRFPGELRFGSDSTEDANWLTNLLYPLFQSAGPRDAEALTGANPSYYQEGFLVLQHLVSVFISLKNRYGEVPIFTDIQTELPIYLTDHRLPFINMRRFPYASYKSDDFLPLLKIIASLLFVTTYLFTCTNTVKSITLEKEKQLKQTMKIMGLSNWLHWTAWFFNSLIQLIISMALVVLLLKTTWITDYAVFIHSDSLVVIYFLSFYACATITLCFAISVFFSKANTSTILSGGVWMLLYMPYYFVERNYDNSSLWSKLLTSLGSNTAMAYGFRIIIMYEGSGKGIQFNNIWKPSSVDDDLSLGIVMVMLTLDCLLYLLIALYVEAVFPGEYGVPQRWYFPFTKTFWCGQPKYTGIEDFGDSNANEGDNHESEPTNLPVGIKIRNLQKSFGRKAAVRNLSLNMYQDQITVLIGHNGAGKTTTVSMLTGMFPPTGGTAFVNGHDIRTEMKSVQDSLGLCPQHNIIFDELTVLEHLYFVSRLKGLKGKEIKAEINKYLDLLELQPKKDERSSTLSGGMKRKLCVGMALCGNSKVVMLDEPTSGMDPSARRALWDLLLKQKTGRTILLTTHFMDEADLLGDRIAIMTGGELKCCGSSFFLKKKYGAGYRLIMEKTDRCVPKNVTDILRKYIPNIEVHSNVGSELTYLLPDSQSSIFQPMLRDLEQLSNKLGIKSYGISLTTLEEVFIKIGTDHGQDKMNNGELVDNQINSPTSQATVHFAGSPTSCQLLMNQIMAMTMKKILSTIRSWILLLIHILIPVIFIIMLLVWARTQNTSRDLPAMSLGLDRYSDPVTLVEGYNLNNDSQEYGERYKSIVGNSYKGVDSIRDTMFQLTNETPTTVRRHYITGASFSNFSSEAYRLADLFDVNFTAYFNNDPYHAPAVALGLAANAMYKKVTGCENCGIEFINHPLAYSSKTQITQLYTSNNLGYLIALCVGFSMTFVSPFYVLFIVRERVSKSKHLQFVSGVNVFMFWMVTWLWDFITYLIIIFALLITLICFQEDGFNTAEEIGRLFLIFLYFGWSMLPMIYLAGYFFDIPASGYSRTSAIAAYLAILPFVIMQMMITPGDKSEYICNILHWVFLVVPHYSMMTGIRDIYTTYARNNRCNSFHDICRQQCPGCTKQDCLDSTTSIKTYCEDVDENYFKWAAPGIGRNLLFSFTVGTVLLLVLLMVEYRFLHKIIYKIRQTDSARYPVEVPDEDADVQEEKHKIRNIPEAELAQNYTMVLRDLTKYYRKFLAVNGLCLGIKQYECFGLMGINGAGKTTTFKMLTGDVEISHGDAWVNGMSIKHETKKVQKSIGYCPQFDALLDYLTARETLVMFSLIRGIPRRHCNRIAVKLAKDFDYFKHLDKKVKELSGGNKRKLSTSIAVIGDQPVIFLDEPTTGIDPGSKRYLWNALCQVRDSGKTIVLTSHSMEECEALCTRLAIMVNGNFKCLGSTQHLKNKFAEGYTITIKVKKPDNRSANQSSATRQLERFMQENFPRSILLEKHEELLTYYVTDKSMPWSKMFGVLEKAKRTEDLNIEDYSLGQSSLEQVFLTFTKHQIDAD